MNIKDLTTKQWVTSIVVLVVALYVLAPLFNMSGGLGLSTLSVRQAYPESAGMVGSGGMAYDKSMAPSIAPAPPVYDGGLGDVTKVTERKVVKNGSLSLLVDKATETAEKVKAVAVKFQGFTETVNIYDHDSGAKSGNITLRIPATSFDAAMVEVKALAIKVEQEQVNTSDVTEQYIDMEARLKNAKAEEEQYRVILRQASRVEDILTVTRQLAEVRTRIDQYQGQLNYLSRQVDMSTLAISLREEAAPSQVGTEWRPVSVVKQGLTELAQGVVDLVNVIILVVLWLPLLALWLLVIGCAAWLLRTLVMWIRRKFNK